MKNKGSWIFILIFITSIKLIAARYSQLDSSCNTISSEKSTIINNNLRFLFYENGFKVSNLSEVWFAEILLNHPNTFLQKKSTENKIIFIGDPIIIEFVNNRIGMRENFYITEDILPEKGMELDFEIKTNGMGYTVDSSAVKLIYGGKNVYTYSDLKVFDATGRILKSYFQTRIGGFKIIIDDENAVYPILVDPISTDPNWIGQPNQTSAGYGISVASAGDVNGDGYDDILSGSHKYDNGQSDEGKVYLYFGGQDSVSSVPNWTYEIDQDSAYLGRTVASAGDVNGDGYSDIVIGAPLYNNDQVDEGRIYLFYGSSTGPSTTYDWYAESNQASSGFGQSVACAGDVNNDGYDDVIVGAYTYDNGQSNEGRVYVYYGSSSGLPLSASWIYEPNVASTAFGFDVGTAGDVNGDGYDDILVGSYGYDNGQTDEGRAFVFHGSSTGLPSAPNWFVESNQISALLGRCVSTAGDVNGDGYDDVIVCSYQYDNGQTNEGRVYVYNGSASGLNTTSSWYKESNQAESWFGYSASNAGDVNNDGYGDIIIGSPTYDYGQADEGRAYIYLGTASGLSTSLTWVNEPNQAGATYGNDVACAGDVNGDSYDDIIVAADNYDNPESAEGVVFLYCSGTPLPFNLLSPNGVYIESYPEFIWQSSVDNNVEFYNLFVNGIFKTSCSETTYIDSTIYSDGVYTWYAEVFDSTGLKALSNQSYEFFVDFVKPTQTILVRPTNGTFTNNGTLIWRTSVDLFPGISYYEVLLDTDTLFDVLDTQFVSDTIFWPSLVYDSTIYWKVRAVNYNDKKGNWSIIGRFKFDDIQPTNFNLVSPQEKVNDNTPILSWMSSFDEHFDKYEVYFQESLIVTTTDTFYQFPYTLEDGFYHWYVIAYDSAGNVQFSDNYENTYFFLDATKPSKVDLAYPNDSSFCNTNHFIWFNAYDNIYDNLNYILLYDTSTLFLTPDTFAIWYDTIFNINRNDGYYFWKVRAFDDHDNYGDWSDVFMFKQDCTNPEYFNLVSPNDTVLTEMRPAFIWNRSYDLHFKEYDIYLNDSLFMSSADTFASPAADIDEGLYNWYVIAEDSATNTMISDRIGSFKIDTTAPEVVSKVSPSDVSYTKSSLLTWNISEDNLTGVRYEINIDNDSLFDNAMAYFTVDINYSLSIIDSTYFWKVRAIDEGGNCSEWSNIWKFTYDTKLPTAFTVYQSNDYTNDNTPLFFWQASFDKFMKSYSLYINAVLKTTTSDTFYNQPTGFTDGQYIWYVTATDSANNIRVSSKRDTLYIDATAPSQVVLSSPANSAVTNLNKLLWRKATDNYSGIVGYELKYDLNSDFSSSSTVVVSDTFYSPVLLDTTYYWKVRSIDRANNYGTWSSTRTFIFDGNAPAAPELVYPVSFVEVEDSFIDFNWNNVTKEFNATAVNYIIQIDTNYMFTLPMIIDTVLADSTEMKITSDRKYYWRVKAFDLVNQGVWSPVDSFELDIKIPIPTLNKNSYNYFDIDKGKDYLWNSLYLKNNGDKWLFIDSITFSDQRFEKGLGYSFPMLILPFDSFCFYVKAFSTDTGSASCKMRVWHDIYSVQNDSLELSSHFGVPTVIDSAVAYDGSSKIAGVDADDYLVLYFNQSTNGLTINNENIDQILSLSNTHSWLDGFSYIENSLWNGSKNWLLINFTDYISQPTINIGDTIFPDSLSIIGVLNSFRCHYPVVIKGTFGDNVGTSAVNVAYRVKNGKLVFEINDEYNTSYEKYLIYKSFSRLEEFSFVGSCSAEDKIITDYNTELKKQTYYRIYAQSMEGNNNLIEEIYYDGTMFIKNFEFNLTSMMSKIILKISTDREENANLQLIDKSGRTLIEKNIYLPYGISEHLIDCKNISSGVYFLKLNTEERKVIGKVLVIK